MFLIFLLIVLILGCMWRAWSLGNLVEPINKVDCYFHERRQLLQTQRAMAENNNRPLKEYVIPSNKESSPSIVYPLITSVFFWVKTLFAAHGTTKPFFGSLANDPNLHLLVFVEYCNTLKCNGVDPNVIWIILFLFSLRDRARAWL